jgi:hypothetical protein
MALTLCAVCAATGQPSTNGPGSSVDAGRNVAQSFSPLMGSAQQRKLGDIAQRNVAQSFSPLLGSSQEPIPPVVIQFSGGTSNALEQKLEDLTVMTRLIEKALEGALGDEETTVKMGVRMLLTASSRSVRTMYVEGLGPLFMIKVDFPLVPPAAGEEKPPSTARSEWDKARAEVKGTEPAGDDPWGVNGSSRVPYNQELVEALTQTVLGALKQAAHIRDLKPDEYIAVSVFGPATTAGAGTVLTLRAKKSDVDAFAKGDLNLEGFRRLATLNKYAGAGYDITSAGSWVHGPRSISRNVAPYDSSVPRPGR